jgi:hypothetical protein
MGIAFVDFLFSTTPAANASPLLIQEGQRARAGLVTGLRGTAEQNAETSRPCRESHAVEPGVN